MYSNEEMAHLLAEAIRSAGGRAWFVGGYVRDRILGKENKDIDIEVHGLTPSVLRTLLETFGTCNEYGSSFGVFSLSGYDLDIAMPRKEKATGRGHKDFSIFVDPFLGTRAAAERRDFTINALMEDVLTGEVLDHFGGLEDLENGVLRHVNSGSFVEDPLRVFRACQFAARFGFSIAPETMLLCSQMDLTTLPCERVMEELKKALLKSAKPSVFFTALRGMQQLQHWFPEVGALIGVEQSPVWHPEGDVWNHTMLVLDSAAALCAEAEQPLWFMLSALVHDFGKVCTTFTDAQGRIRAFNHELEGLPIIRSFLHRLTHETTLTKYVLNMAELHMLPNQLAAQNSSLKATNKLFDRAFCPADLLLLAQADRLGSCGGVNSEAISFLNHRLQVYLQLIEKPSVKGTDLIAAGLSPGPIFSDCLAYAHKLHLAGVEKELALKQTLAYAAKRQKPAASTITEGHTKDTVSKHSGV